MMFFRYILLTLFHPTQAYYKIQKQAPRWFAFVLIPFACIMPVLSIYMTHYPLQSADVRDKNVVVELLTALVLIVTWIVANYAVSTINDGEAQFRSVMVGTAFSLLPYIIFTVPLALASNLMCAEELGLYRFLKAVIYIWVGILLFIQVATTNNYTLGQTLFNIIVTLVCMIMVWAAISIIFLQVSDWYHFIKDVLYELKIMALNG